MYSYCNAQELYILSMHLNIIIKLLIYHYITNLFTEVMKNSRIF